MGAEKPVPAVTLQQKNSGQRQYEGSYGWHCSEKVQRGRRTQPATLRQSALVGEEGEKLI